MCLNPKFLHNIQDCKAPLTEVFFCIIVTANLPLVFLYEEEFKYDRKLKTLFSYAYRYDRQSRFTLRGD